MATPDTSWFDQLDAAPPSVRMGTVGATSAPTASPVAASPSAPSPSGGGNDWFDSLEPPPSAPQSQQASPAQPSVMSDTQRQAWLRAGINPLPPSSNSTVEAVRQWLAPDPNKAYTSIAPLSRDSQGLHLALPNIVRGALYGLTESPSEATTIDTNTGSLG